MTNYEPIIGLEIHVELKTTAKMFCGCDANFFQKEPNSHCCPVCLGLPGALPVPNRKAVEWCVMLGLALNCQVNEESYFERKNYFYPDLPKGYQISQYTKPLTYRGWLKIKSQNSKLKNDVEKIIRINRVHMEEDTGKLTHATIEGKKCSLVDFNRSGVPLVEIVTEPDFTSTEEVTVYLKKLHQIIRYLGVSDADMEKGSMRLEPTINLKITKDPTSPKSQGASNRVFYTPLVEIKNINSFRFVKEALQYEIQKQKSEFEKTGEVKTTGNKTTVGYDEDKKVTVLQRSKEEANDYRYFPEPDVPPMRFRDEDIKILRAKIPELPDVKIARFRKEYGLSEYDANLLCDGREVTEYYEACLKVAKSAGLKGITPKIVANWMINKRADISTISPDELIKLINSKQQIISITDEELDKIIRKIIQENPKPAADYKAGKESALMFLVGMAMREVKDSSQAEKIKTLIKEELK